MYLADLGRRGRFALGRARLQQVAGRPLIDGGHTLRFWAQDEYGNSSEYDLPFALDAPACWAAR